LSGAFIKTGAGTINMSTGATTGGKLTLGGDNSSCTFSVDITGGGTLDVGSFAFLNTSIVLNINNWDKTVDFFYSTNWTGATQDVLDNMGSKPESQVVFAGWSANNFG
jgi:hypothetical protein